MLFYNDDKLVLTLSPRHETGLSTRLLGITIALIYYIKLLLQFNSVYPVHRINGQAAVPICRPTIPIRPSCSANLQANKNTKQWPSCSANLQTDKNAKQWPSSKLQRRSADQQYQHSQATVPIRSVSKSKFDSMCQAQLEKDFLVEGFDQATRWRCSTCLHHVTLKWKMPQMGFEPGYSDLLVKYKLKSQLDLHVK